MHNSGYAPRDLKVYFRWGEVDPPHFEFQFLNKSFIFLGMISLGKVYLMIMNLSRIYEKLRCKGELSSS